jgi:hypothetical protein
MVVELPVTMWHLWNVYYAIYSIIYAQNILYKTIKRTLK